MHRWESHSTMAVARVFGFSLAHCRSTGGWGGGRRWLASVAHHRRARAAVVQQLLAVGGRRLGDKGHPLVHTHRRYRDWIVACTEPGSSSVHYHLYVNITVSWNEEYSISDAANKEKETINKPRWKYRHYSYLNSVCLIWSTLANATKTIIMLEQCSHVYGLHWYRLCHISELESSLYFFPEIMLYVRTYICSWETKLHYVHTHAMLHDGV